MLEPFLLGTSGTFRGSAKDLHASLAVRLHMVHKLLNTSIHLQQGPPYTFSGTAADIIHLAVLPQNHASSVVLLKTSIHLQRHC